MSELLNRRSIRIYDKKIKISKKEMTEILKKAMRAPSSMNMQSYRVLVVESPQMKEKLKTVLYGNQTQLETSSAMLCVFTDLQKFKFANKVYNRAYEYGLMPKEVRNKQLENINNLIPQIPIDDLEKTGWLDAGLFIMQLMHIAREHGYDTCSIGGFKYELLAETLGLDPNRYKPVLIVSIGKKAEAGFPSVRLDVKDVAKWI